MEEKKGFLTSALKKKALAQLSLFKKTENPEEAEVYLSFESNKLYNWKYPIPLYFSNTSKIFKQP